MEPSWLFSRDTPAILASLTAAPLTTPSLTANLVCRVTLAIISNLVCLVPFRLLYKNGEFSASVFILTVEIRNLFTIIFSLIWRNNDMESWWPGYGLCDVYPYIFNFTLALYSTCLLAIMRNLAHQVGLLRVNPLTVREKRRRNIIQALIMFPLPIVQLAMTWPLTLQRYAIGTFAGCTWVAYPAWPYLVFFVIAPVVVALLTAVYAVIIYFRFRQVAQNSRSALSSNRVALMRAQRTRRRLYLMVIAILIPFLPVVCTLAVLNIFDMGSILPFDYHTIHNHTSPYPWNTILFTSSNDLGFAFLNISYVCILSGIPIFIFFGLTKDAINDYRRVLLVLGLGRLFPRLHQEYDPDNSASGDSAAGSSQVFSSTSASSSKFRSLSISKALTTIRSSSGDSSRAPRLQSLNILIPIDLEQAPTQLNELPQSHSRITPEEETQAQPQPQPPLPIPNPFPFRTRFDVPSPLHFSSFKLRPHVAQATPSVPLQPIQRPIPGNWNPHPDTSHVRTRVWSDDEIALCDNQASNISTNSIDSIQGVMVETALTRETHRARRL